MIATLTAWAYGFLAVALLLVMFSTASVGVMFGAMFGAACAIGRGLYWRGQGQQVVLRA